MPKGPSGTGLSGMGTETGEGADDAMTLARDDFCPGGFGRAETTLKLRRLRHDMVVSVHDPLSGRILWTRLEFDPRAD